MGMMTIDLGDLNGITIEEIFHYFTLNSDEYGFTAFASGNPHTVIYKVLSLSGEDISVNNENTTNNNSVLELSPVSSIRRISSYSLENVPSPPNEIKKANSLRAFIYTLIDSSDTIRPRPIVKLDEGESINKMRIRYHILNYEKNKKSGPKDTIKQIRARAEENLIDSIRKSKSHFKRDQLWERLRYMSPSYICPFDDFLQLLSASDVEAIQNIDPRISLLTTLGDVFTNDCFNYLADVFKDRSRQFEEKDSIHLVIFASPRLCSHLRIDTDSQSLRLYSVRRSCEYNKDEEDDFISDLVCEILTWLWSKVTSR